MREKITAANWKMNLTKDQVVNYILDFKDKAIEIQDGHRVVIAAPYIYLDFLQEQFADIPAVEIYAQNMHEETSGAFTGEISQEMLQSIGIEGVLIGHSERRDIFDESQEVIHKKLQRATEGGMKVILCCGEPLEKREQEEHRSYILRQLETATMGITEEAMRQVVIAYEPIWAIGTGLTASPEQAQEIHALIRDFLENTYSSELADNTPILYGGSVKPSNAEELFSMQDIDGGLIGGAALEVDSFAELIEIHGEIS